MLPVLLSLGAALSYGLSDFVGGLVSRRTSAWAVAFVGAISSAVFTGVAATFGSGSPRPVDWAWAATAGIASGAGVAFLYRGFSRGRISVVAPVSAVGAALVPAAFGLVGGERPGLLVWVGVVLALPAIWLVASAPEDIEAASPQPGSVRASLVDGVLAGVGFGLLFGLIGQVPSSSGLLPLALTQVVAIPAIVLLAISLRGAWVPRSRTTYWAVLAGPFAGGANLLFLLATQRGYLTVSGVLTSLYPASTVLLAMLVLRERVHRTQAVGLLLCGVTVGLVAAG